ncbi:hypothetical protein GTU73_01900 [Rathayibacter sp. VKM Ac-2804]|uniref:hypothetical protein n=1 Tax=Rathayibacter sp. VKM Ac-2804 TaxID=2609257 RepID=UPI00132F25BC|nr:hypothetical protein [Rathayibacter sp. VKM Ac-2804]QHF22880.1 hypothetical protein GTU73_01900 [Rathayibacter sp. VKM Ac-2804]
MLFRFAKSNAGGYIFGMVVLAVPRLIPGVIFVSRDLVVLKHPRPISVVHLVAVPRKYLRDIQDSTPLRDVFLDRLSAWWRQEPVVEYVGISNVGVRQEVRYLHVHLVGGASLNGFRSVAADRLSVGVQMAVREADQSGAAYVARTYSFAPINQSVGWLVSVDQV